MQLRYWVPTRIGFSVTRNFVPYWTTEDHQPDSQLANMYWPELNKLMPHTPEAPYTPNVSPSSDQQSKVPRNPT